jgi:hypothetical protein
LEPIKIDTQCADAEQQFKMLDKVLVRSEKNEK